MHATGGHQAEQVEPAVSFSGGRSRPAQRLVLDERAVPHGVVDAGDVLLDHRPRAEIEVAHL
jgi:hypothetical protein